MSHFLLRYHRPSGELLRIEEFPGADGGRESLRERFSLERESTDPDVEIVTIQADGLDELRRTHSRYFRDVRELAEDLAADLQAVAS